MSIRHNIFLAFVSLNFFCVESFLQHQSLHGVVGVSKHHSSLPSTITLMSLKPAAIPLLDSGKAFARSGEFLIDITDRLDLYGGALSAAGANIRNSGDSIAQAAASCRFKTGTELVIDELREAATCLSEGAGKLRQAVKEAQEDDDEQLSNIIFSLVSDVERCSTSLESAGAGIMQRQSIAYVGERLEECGDSMSALSQKISLLSPELQESKDCSQRIAFAGERMTVAGASLKGTTEKQGGKSFLKGNKF